MDIWCLSLLGTTRTLYGLNARNGKNFVGASVIQVFTGLDSNKLNFDSFNIIHKQYSVSHIEYPLSPHKRQAAVEIL